MAKKATTTKENPVEEKSIDMTPEMEELKKQVDGLKLENEELPKSRMPLWHRWKLPCFPSLA